jgi:hypothetical protein
MCPRVWVGSTWQQETLTRPAHCHRKRLRLANTLTHTGSSSKESARRRTLTLVYCTLHTSHRSALRASLGRLLRAPRSTLRAWLGPLKRNRARRRGHRTCAPTRPKARPHRRGTQKRTRHRRVTTVSSTSSFRRRRRRRRRCRLLGVKPQAEAPHSASVASRGAMRRRHRRRTCRARVHSAPSIRAAACARVRGIRP